MMGFTEPQNMRRFYPLLAVALFVLVSCSDSPTESSRPAVPASPLPADASTDQPTMLTLSWTSKGGADHYDVYLGKSSPPTRVVQNLTAPHYRPARLTANTPYYWRVVSRGPGGESEGPLWMFTTTPGVAPAPPSQPDPPDNSSVAADPVDLTWSPAPGDSLAFNVYFGKDADPPLVASDLTTNSYAASVMAGATYHWRVETKNLDGLVASGPTWRFNAQPAPGHMYNVAGTGQAGFGALSQKPLDTQLFHPQDIAFDPAGNLVVVDWNNHRILAVNPADGTFYLAAGTLDGNPGVPCAPYPAPCDGIDAVGAKINHPTSITFRADGMMALSGWHNYAVFLIDPTTSTMARVVGTGQATYGGEEIAANTSAVNRPSASVYDAAGELIISDQYDAILRRVDVDGVIHRFAGQAPVWDGTRWIPQRGFFGDEGPALSAKFNWDVTTTCGKLAIDAAGNIYVADTFNHAIRMIDASGVIHRFAGVYPATPGFSGDGGPATSAQLNEPRDVACDTSGNVFIADTANHAIRMVASDGIITTVAGIPGVTGTGTDDGKLATQSGLDLPFGIDVDTHGNLWIADTYNSRIRVVYR